MIRTLTSFLGLALSFALLAGSGGPDDYGYTWKDSDEPDGPVFNWIDITTTGTLVSGLADDNVVGPIIMATNFPYYWYSPKKLWIGSNGYVAFQNTNIASPFPIIPTAGGGNDFIAGMMCDLTFSGASNPGECYLFDDLTTTIVSYINVPFWSAASPFFAGSNTFQIILDKSDSTITIQYQQQTGLTLNNDLAIGIESITGDIGLQHSADTYPLANYAIRFYNPPNPLLDVTDAAMNWVTDPSSGGLMLAKDGAPFPLIASAINTGNQDLSNFTLAAEVRNSGNQIQASGAVVVNSLAPTVDTVATYPAMFMPTVTGTYRMIGTVSGVVNELVSTNNSLTQELIVYDTTQSVLNLTWAGPTDDNIGLGWNGGNGGVGVFIEPPYHPAYIAATTVRIESNIGAIGMFMRVYDDDGTNGGPGTLLDSVYVPAAMATPGDHAIPLANPFMLTSGGLYVQWYMEGPNISISRDIVAPFSKRTYEVLDNTWAEYRDRETEDFHLGLQITPEPLFDAGCTNYFGIINGSVVGQPTTVRTWVKNFGNQTVNNFPVKYQFESDPVVSQNFTGPALAPGDSALFTFSQQLQPVQDAAGSICAWSELPNDAALTNDTICVQITIATDIAEIGSAEIGLGPNPSDQEVMLSTPVEAIGTALLVLHDLEGRLVRSEQVMLLGSAPLRVDVSQLDAGVYLLQVQHSVPMAPARLVIQR